MTASPPTRTCTLIPSVGIERGTMADWHALAPLHYRSRHAGAVTDVFRMTYAPSRRAERTAGQAASGSRQPPGQERSEWPGTPPPDMCHRGTCPTRIGVIVYARPALSLAARDRATGGRYRAAGLGRTSLAALVNREVRVISRAVIAPNWRGLGLATRLVAETLPQVGTPYVEALAAMGHVHPFFERAGMTAYPCRPSPAGERLKAALEAVGLGRTERRSAAALGAALARLAPAERRLAAREIDRWARSYLGAKNHRTNRPDRPRTLALVARHLDAAPVYYLWRKEDRERRIEGTRHPENGVPPSVGPSVP
jgi:GNAT superfamily N-acetyltransferase